MTDEFATFSEEAVLNALRSAEEADNSLFERRLLNDKPVEDILFSLRAECISVTVTSKGVCVRLPLGLGDVCIPLPIDVEIGTVAQACLDIYYKNILGVKVPAGVEVSVYAGGQLVARMKFGL